MTETTTQARFECNSGDGAVLIADYCEETYPGEVTISIAPKRGVIPFVILSVDTAKQLASSIMRCAFEAEKYHERT